MNKTLYLNQIQETIISLKEKDKKIILVGGCFDILHTGHIFFLNNAKKYADTLIVLLESDDNIKKYKGNNRPINTQNNRLIILSALSSIDFIIPLKGMTKNEDYDKLIVQIEPDYIALTKGDKNILQRQKQCEMVGAKLIQLEKTEGESSSSYIDNIK